jgi:hypothetical protein
MGLMEHISLNVKRVERTIIFDGADAVSAAGFVQLPNFILKNSTVSIGAHVT